ncbi:phosphatase PAP2 family protein [Blastococcus saxobsidens]|uniref:Putative membrane-associated phospholipid phosphatase n=1 Tax=Blastococcus saxobsidens (strain DD2) TaxID=1146883 RepID=H6RNA7_BLASD|nr:phosphatase PAP2 family protein [Blastococcus saxobsidens]CCG02655.1 Putative membrane-associated phospholipid phosphatase [Blastococcus saxobsidens DD2]
MSRVAEHVDTSPEGAAGVGRFGARAALGLAALLIGAVPFLLLVLLVQEEWSPLASLDGEVAAGLNAVASDSPTLVSVLRVVTDLGGNFAAILIFTLTTVFLLIRGQRRLAAFTVATGIGLAILVPVTKALIGRARPVVENPVNELPSNASFPSGHAMVSIVTFGMLALLALPAVRRHARPWVVAAALLIALAVGFTRLALGVHFVTDVLAGWALGVGLLAVTTAAFRGWQHDHHHRPDESLDPLDVEPHAGPHLAPSRQPALPAGKKSGTALVVAAAALAAALIVLGLLITAVLGDSVIGRFDRAVVQAVADLRTPTLTDIATAVGMLSGTPMVIAVSLTLGVVALAVTASWRPVVFVAVTVLGEVGLYFVVSRIVERARPAVADLTSNLPTAASWPSGHVAAAVAIYGALAALVITLSRSRWRWAVLAVPALVAPAVALSRIYTAAHYPTDVVAGLVLGTVWMLACARYLLPDVDGQVRYPGTSAPARPVPAMR